MSNTLCEDNSHYILYFRKTMRCDSSEVTKNFLPNFTSWVTITKSVY